MSRIDSSSLLQMRSAILQQNAALQKAAQKPADAATIGTPGIDGAQKPSDFTNALGKALSSVNDLQSKANAASDAYERGETTDIAAVMLQREKAGLGFQATLQVRNKLLAAYKDIMSMPV